MKKLKNKNIFDIFLNRSPFFRGKQILLILLIFSGLLATNGFALPVSNKVFQQAQILVSGTVTDVNGIALPSVTIQEKGTNNGVLTDFDGNFTIEVRSTESILEFNYMGMKPLSRIVGGNTSMNVQMEQDAALLDEVVIVGYGTQKKSDVTGSLVSIGGEDLESTPRTNIEQMLQGKAAGLNITVNQSNAEGSNNTMLVRGQNSIFASNNPLIIFDGIPYSGSLSELNPNDIASIEILKDASSTAIYGSRGANGVILLTSKSGKSGQLRVNYEGSYTIDQIANVPDLMDGATFYEAKTERGIGTTLIEDEGFATGRSTDWVDISTRNGERQKHNLSFSGGNDMTKFYLSFSSDQTKGIAIGQL